MSSTKTNLNNNNNSSSISLSSSSNSNPDIFEYVFFKNYKISKSKNKKIISTSVFLPQNPTITFKTTFYIVGLIKNVERFHKIMPNGWKFRIYYDSMFDEGIKTKDIEDSIKVDKKSIFTQKSNENSNNDFKNYKYNSKFYKSRRRNSFSTKEIKKNTKKNLKYIKKMVKLFQIYINFIKISKLEKYKNIELVSYNCPYVKKRGILGHPSTFGSMMRFMPLYDHSVETFCCVNSRGYISPIMRSLFNELYDKPEKKVLAVKYSAEFIKSWGLDFIREKIECIKERLEKGKKLRKNEEIFRDIINGILSFKDEFLNPTNPFNLTIEKIKYSTKSRDRFTDIVANPNFRDIEGVYDNFVGLKSIAAGVIGLKKKDNFIETRKYLFNKFLVYLIQGRYDFKYGIDELALIYCILPDVGLCNIKYKNENTTTFGFNLKKQIKKEIEMIYANDNGNNNVNNSRDINEKIKKKKINQMVERFEKKYHFYNFHKSSNYIIFDSIVFDTNHILCGKNRYLENEKGEKLCFNNYLKSHFSSYFNRGFSEHFGKSGSSFLLFYNGLLESKKIFEVINELNPIKKTKKFNFNNKIVLEYPSIPPSHKEVFYMCISKDSKTGFRGIDVANMQHSFNEYKTLVLINKKEKGNTLDENDLYSYFNHPIEIKKIDKNGNFIKKESTIGREFYHVLDLNNFKLRDMNLLMKEMIQYFSKDIIENEIRYIKTKPSEFFEYNNSSTN
jgi:hypothetical protein